jgi:hypothetical protein
MSTGQTVLTIFAFILLMTMVLNFYRLIGSSGESIAESQDRIMATSIGSSLVEFAQSLAYDNITVDSDSARGNPGALTKSNELGPDTKDTAGVIRSFDDFDDFNGAEIEQEAGGTNGRFRVRFSVYYVNSSSIDVPSSVPTFVKRMDMKIWRVDNIEPGVTVPDTVSMFTTSGYFHFN